MAGQSKVRQEIQAEIYRESRQSERRHVDAEGGRCHVAAQETRGNKPGASW